MLKRAGRREEDSSWWESLQLAFIFSQRGRLDPGHPISLPQPPPDVHRQIHHHSLLSERGGGRTP